MITLTINYLHETHRPLLNEAHKTTTYRVVQVEQTTDYTPGQYMTKAEVQDLCDLPKKYKVIIKGIK